MKKIFVILGILVVLLVGLGIALPVLGLVTAGDGTDGAGQWKTQKIDRGDIPITVNATGNIEPLASIKVGSQVSGKVKNVFVEPDDLVAQGAVLAEIDTELLEAELRDRNILLEKARTGLDMLDIEVRNLNLRERDVKLALQRAEVSVARAEATLELTTKNLQREKDVLAVGDSTLSKIDLLTLEMENAQRDLKLRGLDQDTGKLELERIAAERATLAARRRSMQNDNEQAQQAVAKAKTNLGYARILSPIDGVVLDRVVQPGQTIAASFQTPDLFTIVHKLDTVRVLVQIDESEVGRILPGMEVSFEVDAYRHETFKGTVVAVRLKSDLRGNLVTYPVLIDAPNPPSKELPHGKLRPGMTAYVTFEVETIKDVPRVPAAALRFFPPDKTYVDKSAVQAAEHAKSDAAAESDASAEAKPEKAKLGMPATVYTVIPAGVKALPIMVGESDGEYYELLSGELKPDDEVITGKVVPDAAGRARVRGRR